MNVSWKSVSKECTSFISLYALHKKSPYSRLFCPNVEKCGKNADQDNSEYERFLRSDGIYVYSIQKVFFDWKKVLFSYLNFIFFQVKTGFLVQKFNGYTFYKNVRYKNNEAEIDKKYGQIKNILRLRSWKKSK